MGADTMDATAGDTAIAKAQEFAHRVVEFADVAACLKFFDEKQIDFDRPNAAGATVLMTVVARGRVDLIGLVMDRTTNVEATTVPNGTTVLHLAAMASNSEVIKELTATDARKAKLRSIANACNRNGDTPLMMASVVKNAVAAKILVEYLDALATLKNATGMTALMCASRLRDAREGPLMANESASIVSLLLAYGADVNAAEYAGRQTALHFALLTNNIMVVEQLLTILDINLTARNKAGHSPLELARKLKLDGLIDAAVESQWQVVEEEAQLLSDQVAQELENVAESSVIDSAKKAHKKKDKLKKKTATTQKKQPASRSVDLVQNENDREATEVTETGEAQLEPAEPVAAASAIDDEDVDEWVTATKKKSKRKESISEDPPQNTTQKLTKPSSAANHNHKAKPKKKVETGSERMKSTVTGPQPPRLAKMQTQSKPVPSAAAPVPSQRKPAPWSTGAPQNNSHASASPPTSQHVAQETTVSVLSEEAQSSVIPSEQGMTYDDLSTIFHRMYPIAGEMDIPVETFIAGAPTHDAKALLDGLSVSQIEMLQEAHLQAYHYLNERKIEMARILEAERLEAQLQLRRRLYDVQ